jgi:hypothetical protein
MSCLFLLSSFFLDSLYIIVYIYALLEHQACHGCLSFVIIYYFCSVLLLKTLQKCIHHHHSPTFFFFSPTQKQTNWNTYYKRTFVVRFLPLRSLPKCFYIFFRYDFLYVTKRKKNISRERESDRHDFLLI